MLIFGKMSVGVVMITSGLRIRISNAMTTKVYGRSSAVRTIHMDAGSSRADRGYLGNARFVTVTTG
jgi:hypothetical protein